MCAKCLPYVTAEMSKAGERAWRNRLTASRAEWAARISSLLQTKETAAEAAGTAGRTVLETGAAMLTGLLRGAASPVRAHLEDAPAEAPLPAPAKDELNETMDSCMDELDTQFQNILG